MLLTQPDMTITNPDLSKLTFNEFVTGPSNQEAYDHAFAYVSDHPSNKPLIICADVGMGKTHLAVAIGHALLDKRPGLSVCYCSSMQFEEDAKKLSEINQLDVFVDWFSNRDLLLIDDIDELSVRGGSRETFLRIFDKLCAQNRKVVLTVSPGIDGEREQGFFSHLRHRCTLVRVETPCVETRLATINLFNSKEGQFLPDDVVFFLCNLKGLSLEELCGFVSSLKAYSSYADVDIDIAIVRKFLLDREVISTLL